MLKFKNKIIVASLTLLMLVGCSNTNTTQKVSPEGTQRLYGVDVGGPGTNQNHPIYGNDGIFGY